MQILIHVEAPPPNINISYALSASIKYVEDDSPAYPAAPYNYAINYLHSENSRPFRPETDSSLMILRPQQDSKYL